jgi:trimethylamine:corrinoid methyltransferase-like protein
MERASAKAPSTYTLHNKTDSLQDEILGLRSHFATMNQAVVSLKIIACRKASYIQ